MFTGVLAGLTGASSSSWAQSVSEPAPADAVQPPPNDAEPSAPDVTQPPLNGAEPSTGGGVIATIAIDALDKPWNRGVPEDRRWAARELFLEGNRLFRIPLFAKAAERYVVALGKWKHPAIYLNLAIAQLNAGQEVEARDSLEHALEHGEEPLGADNFRGAQQQFEEVTRQLGRIRVSCRTPGAQVTLDGASLFMGPGSYEGWVTAKEHEILAKKSEYLSEARRVTIISGQHQEIYLKLITLSEATDASRRWAVWKPGLVTAVGGVIVAAGGVLHTLAFKNFSTYDDKVALTKCGTPMDDPFSGCFKGDPELLRYDGLLRRARQQQQIAIGGYIVGVSLIATGVALLYMNRPRLEEMEPNRPPARRFSMGPMVSNDMLGVLIDISQ
jgi:hypothetical protein